MQYQLPSVLWFSVIIILVMIVFDYISVFFPSFSGGDKFYVIPEKFGDIGRNVVISLLGSQQILIKSYRKIIP